MKLLNQFFVTTAMICGLSSFALAQRGPGPKMICADAGGGWYQLTNLSTGEAIGRPTAGLNSCQALIQ
jgi:hypothetical protein